MDFNIWQLLAGIGILLYWMHNFEQTLNVLWGKKLKLLLQKYTKTSWMAIRTGAWTTTLLQSSTLVSLLILAFVGAGIMPLQNAIGVIIWANVGSPMLPLFAALIWFNEFDIATLAYPLIGIGAIIIMFIKAEKWQWYAKLLIWFGLFFIWIAFMKESVEAIKNSFDITQFANLSLRWFGLLGMVFSAIMSSSGALWIITLTAVGGGIISFPASVAIMMWANIWTTWTAFLASLWGNRAKRQVAMSHVLFNVLSTVFGVALFWQFIWFSNDVLWLADNPALSNAVLAVVYNVFTCVIFGLVLKPFTKLVIRAVPDKKDTTPKLHIESVEKNLTNASFVNPALLALQEDCKNLVYKGHEYVTFINGLTINTMNDQTKTPQDSINARIEWNKQTHITMYETTREIAEKLLIIATRIKQFTMEATNAKLLHNIETTVYSTLKAMKAIKNIHRDMIDLREAVDPTSKDLYTKFLEAQGAMSRHLAFVKTDLTSNYEHLIQAVQILKKHHATIIQEITTAATQGKLKEIGMATMINVDHYFYEANEKLALAFANAYLLNGEVDTFETTQGIDQEIYESFTTD
jgi:phosphate:Na+ symporter